MSTLLGFRSSDIQNGSLWKNQKFSCDPVRSYQSFSLVDTKFLILPQTSVVNKTS